MSIGKIKMLSPGPTSNPDKVQSGATPIKPDKTKSIQGPNSSNADHCNRKNKNRSHHTRFKGKCQAIKQFTYNNAAPNSSQDLFACTTREIAEYVAQEFASAGEFRLGMVNHHLPDLVEPSATSINETLHIQIKKYKMKLKRYEDKVKAH